MITFCAPEKLGRSFISASRLHLPNINYHISAFWAFHPHGWHSIYLILFPYNCDLLLQVVYYDFAASLRFCFWCLFLLDVLTFRASKWNFFLRFFGNETRTAIWTKLHDNYPSCWGSNRSTSSFERVRTKYKHTPKDLLKLSNTRSLRTIEATLTDQKTFEMIA